MHSVQELLEIYNREELERVYKKTSLLLQRHGAVPSYQRPEAPKPLQLPTANPVGMRPITSFFKAKQPDFKGELPALAQSGVEVSALDHGSSSDCICVGETTPSQPEAAKVGPCKPPGNSRANKRKAKALSAASQRGVATCRESLVRSCKGKEPKYTESGDEDSDGSLFEGSDCLSELSSDE